VLRAFFHGIFADVTKYRTACTAYTALRVDLHSE